MSVKTLNSAQPMVLPASMSPARTYSIAPIPVSIPASIPEERLHPAPEQIDAFLEAENPLGCIRGVMWVMAFNVAVFLAGFTIWQCLKFFV
jgi:hypothetical protein